jgi:nitrogen fixation/metabolism regulation signal transduction histidine kinase
MKSFLANFLVLLLALALLMALLALDGLLSTPDLSSQSISNYTAFLLVFGGLGGILLCALVLWNILKLFQKYQKREEGIYLTGRLTLVFVLLIAAPLLIIYLLSMRFLENGLESWFEIGMEEVVSDALFLGQAALDVHLKQSLQLVAEAAEIIGKENPDNPTFLLSRLAKSSAGSLPLRELTLLKRDGSIDSTMRNQLFLNEKFLPYLPHADTFARTKEQGFYVALEAQENNIFIIRALAEIPKLRLSDPLEGQRYLQGIFQLTDTLVSRINALEGRFDRYKKLRFQQQILLAAFRFSLTLAVVLTMLFAIWLAIFSAFRLVEPLRKLAEATEAVAAGDYDTRILVSKDRDLAFLTQSFNIMLTRLGDARLEMQEAQQALENQHAYLDTILMRISSGVLAFDEQCRLQRANARAAELLHLDFSTYHQQDLKELLQNSTQLKDFWREISERLHSRKRQWQWECDIPSSHGYRSIICRGSALEDLHSLRPQGTVLVIEDITAIVQAERHAAWSEVARRLAHEIKNPLTPIRLSAERLQYKYLPLLPENQKSGLTRACQTIIEQVDSLLLMVNAFSNYAKAPALHFEFFDFNQLILDISELYVSEGQGRPPVVIKHNLDASLQQIQADRSRLTQVLHNLFKNALEAHTADSTTEKIIEIETVRRELFAGVWLEFSVSDNGPGFNSGLLPKIFEPYVTSKSKGSGLGLAIVQRIVEEHHGRAWAENRPQGGARLVIQLPCLRPVDNTTEN